MIPRSVRISEAPSYGQTVLTYHPDSAGAVSYLQAAQEIAQRGMQGARHERPAPNAAGSAAVWASCSSAPTCCRTPASRRRRDAAAAEPVAGPGPGRDEPYFTDLPTSAITPNPRQPRAVFDEEAMDELVASIHEVGLLQPIVVRPAGEGQFELVMGERRWRAAQQAGLETIPAIVRETKDHDLLRDALLENLHRAQLNPLEEAAAYQQMLEDFGCTQEELASRIKRSRPQISNTIRLLRLPPAVQRRVAAGVLSAGHARALLAIDDPAEQERLAQRVVAEGLSVRADRGDGRGRGDRPRRPVAERRPRPTSRGASGRRGGRSGCPTTWTPGCGSRWAGPRAGSSSTSPPRRTWIASSA